MTEDEVSGVLPGPVEAVSAHRADRGAFTPGPLIVWHQPFGCQSGDGINDSIQTEDGDVVALVALTSGTRADLTLWSAAPDLLAVALVSAELLSVIVEDSGVRGGRTERLLSDTRAAIAKALGREAASPAERPVTGPGMAPENGDAQ